MLVSYVTASALALLVVGASSEALASSRVVKAAFDAAQSGNVEKAAGFLAPSAKYYPKYDDEEREKSQPLTVASFKTLLRGWRIVSIKDCSADLVIVEWEKRGRSPRFSHVEFENGRVIRMTGNTGPLVCTNQFGPNG